MKIIHCALLFLSILSSCTESPVGSDQISGGKRQISGQVTLQGSADPQGVYIWLEGLDITTRTDENGLFEIQLPPVEAQGTPGGVEGAFFMYYFMANYKLQTRRIATSRGEFLYESGDIDANGRVDAAELKKILDIRINIQPDLIQQSRSDEINVELQLQPASDSVTVVFPVSGSYPAGALIAKRQDDSGTIIAFPVSREDDDGALLVINAETKIVSMSFQLGNRLPAGRYELIPHMLIQRHDLPQDIMDKLGQHFNTPTQDYLNIPMRRSGGTLTVTGSN
jgi:hypothetical protein